MLQKESHKIGFNWSTTELGLFYSKPILPENSKFYSFLYDNYKFLGCATDILLVS